MLTRNAAISSALFIAGCTAQVGTTATEANASLQVPEVATVCQLNKDEASGSGRARLVSITTTVSYNLEYGYQLWDHGCEPGPRVDDLLPIDFPPGTSRNIPPDEFPELNKLHSDAFLRAAFEAKKGIYCRCVGEVSYPNGIATFVLRRAEVYLD
jgi:hypothetical protein